MYPFFGVGEGNPKPIGKIKLFDSCQKPSINRRNHARDFDHCQTEKSEGNLKKILHIIFGNEVFRWTISDPY
ncbi:hypothetical protein N7481_008635 [Penicillium waksmanii]|uniref:uncharacterized protein n=1 Tax=Penicillium waksmanii TaxID=69791 RepID=UPI002549B55C|nr:uncharacterized protein N7481_008635 [Penicillium waksmanii]KAJ5974928.1 hypothetical protein N7481_008635 [Penicillium waksmanii]